MVTLRRQIGSILLIAGCCIGAGMLGLPLLTAQAGFVPSVCVLTASWVFMLLTGLLLAEVNLWFDDEPNIISLAERTLGRWGSLLAWGLYLFLFDSLMVAYISGSGAFFSEICGDVFGVDLPHWIGLSTIALLFAGFIYAGTGQVDRVNRLLMAGLGVTYIVMIAMGSFHVDAELLLKRDWGVALWIAPAMIVSFGYHNLIPSLTTYLKHDPIVLRRTIIIGSFLPFLIYVVWEWLILGIIPPVLDGAAGASDEIITQALRRAAGSTWVVAVAVAFSFCALLTSYLAVGLSFVDFLADGFGARSKRLLLVALVIVPPAMMALLYPGIFLKALTYAGAFGAVLLFGVFPVLMVWKGRKLNLNAKRLVGGGKPLLLALLFFALAVFLLQAGLEWRKI